LRFFGTGGLEKTLPKGVAIVKEKLVFHRETPGEDQDIVLLRPDCRGIPIASGRNSGENE
jgi:hypothetical protein